MLSPSVKKGEAQIFSYVTSRLTDTAPLPYSSLAVKKKSAFGEIITQVSTSLPALPRVGSTRFLRHTIINGSPEEKVWIYGEIRVK